MEPYTPKLNFEYPSKPDIHMMKVKVTHERIVDENYPFLNKSFGFRFMRRLVYLGVYTFAFFICFLRCGVKIEGRVNLRKHRELLKNGAMTVSNHIHRWDFIFILWAVRFRMMYFPAWKGNLNGPDETFIRLAGGIPIPDEIHLIKKFYQAFDEVCAKKKWLHSYAEGSLFFYYQPIRPFKKGVFTLAHRYSLPVLPIAFSYRKPRFPYTLVNLFRSIIGRQKLPMVTLRIGEPIQFDTSLSRMEAIQKMRKECHEAVVRLAGISDNPYPAEAD